MHKDSLDKSSELSFDTWIRQFFMSTLFMSVNRMLTAISLSLSAILLVVEKANKNIHIIYIKIFHVQCYLGKAHMHEVGITHCNNIAIAKMQGY